MNLLHNAGDLQEVVERSPRHRVVIATADDGAPIELRPGFGSGLVAGVSGGGKSTKVAGTL